MGGAQFQTGRNSMSPMSPFGRNFIVARSLPRRRPRFARAPCQAFYTEIWRMLDAATQSRKMLRRLSSRLHLDLEAGGGKHDRRRGSAQSCRPPPRSRHSALPVVAAYRCGCLQAAIPILRSCDPRLRGQGRSADRTQGRPVGSPIRVCEHGQAGIGPRVPLTAAQNSGCLVCAAMVRSCPARNP